MKYLLILLFTFSTAYAEDKTVSLYDNSTIYGWVSGVQPEGINIQIVRLRCAFLGGDVLETTVITDKNGFYSWKAENPKKIHRVTPISDKYVFFPKERLVQMKAKGEK